jgi:predicted pyridoxine 5'-phosphate oxidase superfamily flavin-nucleotide-binding protein
MDESPFNSDELAAQALAGGGPRGAGGIRRFMPEPHRLFFAQLSYIFVAAIDTAGWPLATLITGKPGFVQSPDPSTLYIAALPEVGDPAAEALVPGRSVGILGIDFSTRRRNRVNGRILSRDANAIGVAIDQSFGNCPQYVQLRTLAGDLRAVTAKAAPAALESFTRLDEAAQNAIAGADTFFVASRSRTGDGAAFGADVSHRGGRPGFVHVDGDVLTIPDFRGNRYFNTLGNLIAEPRASLLFVDFETGDMLQLQGLAQVDWTGSTEAFTGAERLWRFHIARGWRRRASLPLRWSFREYSPVTLRTGIWPIGARRRKGELEKDVQSMGSSHSQFSDRVS